MQCPQEHSHIIVIAKFEEKSKELAGDEEEESDAAADPISEFRFVPSDK